MPYTPIVRIFPQTGLCAVMTLITLWLNAGASAQNAATIEKRVAVDPATPVDLSKPTLYLTSTAHLDTQWLWTIQTTIDEYIPATLRDNFALFEKYPNYTFSFEGSFRYQLMREYYPQDYERLKDYVRQGRWRICGSSVDAGDVNAPHPEALIRQILYGNLFFEREFGQSPVDIFLPDCFGFGYALPSIAVHCGLKGFSTQKLTWGSAVGIPFDVGVWKGVDGNGVIAALNPGAYVSKLREDLSLNPEWLARIQEVGQASGAFVGYKYFGTGDIGGAPDDASVDWMEKSISGAGPIRVVHRAADQMYKDLSPEHIAKLPKYRGELLMTSHGSGTYTSASALKRWNRQNESLGAAAERAAVMSAVVGGSNYPHDRFEEAWTRVLWHHMHDDLTGTGIPEAYTFSWNDEIISLNAFADILTHAIGGLARGLNTNCNGVPLVIYNPLTSWRTEVLQARVRYDGPAPELVTVVDAFGDWVPTQITHAHDNTLEIAFGAYVRPLSFSIFDVREEQPDKPVETDLIVSDRVMENRLLRVELDANGDIFSLYHKELRKELLDSPVRMALLRDDPDAWPEWEIQYRDVSTPPYAFFEGPAEFRVLESGPARGVIEVTRQSHGSTLIQRIQLCAGDAGDRVVVENIIDWRTPTTMLKAVFPLAARNPVATYDLGFGVIERGNNTEKLHEVPAQHWADLTDASGSFGVTISNDCKHGWDKPNDNTLRLTLIHAPGEVEKDMGWHRATFTIAGHDESWREGNAVLHGDRTNHPMRVFQTTQHSGVSKRFNALSLQPTPQVVVRTVKGNDRDRNGELVVRLQEVHGRAANGHCLGLPVTTIAARELNGAEQEIGPIEIEPRRLCVDFEPFQARTFAIELSSSPIPVSPPSGTPLALPYDIDVVSADAARSDGDFDGHGHSIPAELLPADLVLEDIPFKFGPQTPGAKNAVACRGQTIPLPAGPHRQLYVLAASADGRRTVPFRIGDDHLYQVSVNDWSDWIGQADSLVGPGGMLDRHSMAPAYIHRDPIAWVGTHRHDASTDRNEPYVFCYLFRYMLTLPQGATAVTLPDDPAIRVMAMTVSDNANADTFPAWPLYDEIYATTIEPAGGLFMEPVTVTLSADVPGAEIAYTLDGSRPTLESPRYGGPLEFTQSTTVRSRLIHRGKLQDFDQRARYHFAQPRDPSDHGEVTGGLVARYFEGRWRELPDFSTMQPLRTVAVQDFDRSARQVQDNYGFEFSGYVYLPADGIYTFYTVSDDGSQLYLGNELLVDNDGLHGAQEKRAQVALKSGMHSIRVVYFERGGDDKLEVSYEGPGIARRPLPGKVLFRDADAAIDPPQVDGPKDGD